MAGRFLDALAVCADVIDFDPDEEADNGLRTFLHDCLDNEYTLPYFRRHNSRHEARTFWQSSDVLNG